MDAVVRQHTRRQSGKKRLQILGTSSPHTPNVSYSTERGKGASPCLDDTRSNVDILAGFPMTKS